MAEEAAPPPPKPPRRRKGLIGRVFGALGGALMRGLQALRRAFGKKPKRAARVYWDDDVSLTLSNLVHESETEASGKVQVISLAEFRATVGELWEKYQSRIIMIAETSIARRIGKGNTFIVLDDDTWLLLFPNADEAEAQARADSIAAAIGEKLMGARFAMNEIPLPAAAKLGLADIMNPDGTVNLEAVRGAVASIKSQRGYATPAPKAFARKGAPPRAGVGRIPVARGRAVPQAAPTPAPPPAPTEPPSRIAELTTLYRPAWSADSQSVDVFYFRAYGPDGHNVIEDEGPFLTGATVLDLVKAGLTAFSAMRAADAPGKFVLPLPVSAFTPQVLGEAQRLITALPREDRLGHLRLDLRRLPRANPEQLIALRELFRSSVNGISFPVNPFTQQDALLALDHVTLCADVSRESHRTDTEVFEALLYLRNRASQRPLAVTGLRKRSHLAKAITAGATEVSGQALMDDIKYIPARAQPLPREMLLGM